MIWIRADGGREIGTGHIMRCLSVADALRQLGEPSCFLVADDSAVSILESRKQEYRVLGSSYLRPEEELDTLIPVLKEEKRSALLADSYYVTAAYLRRAGEYIPICYMDDTGICGMPAELHVNYNIFAEPSLYQGEVSVPEKEYLLGTEYVPLRREFGQASYQVRDRAERILITTGGSDKYDLTGKILEYVLDFPGTEDLEYCVVSGAYNRYLTHLRDLEKNNVKVQVYSGVSNMLELMQSCDIAVTAGGTTMYELCAVGVPIVCFSFVDNQQKIVEGFRRREIVCYGGDYLRQGEKLIKEVADHIVLLRNNAQLRRTYSLRQRSLVDGQGAMRIARRLQTLAQSRERRA